MPEEENNGELTEQRRNEIIRDFVVEHYEVFYKDFAKQCRYFKPNQKVKSKKEFREMLITNGLNDNVKFNSVIYNYKTEEELKQYLASL